MKNSATLKGLILKEKDEKDIINAYIALSKLYACAKARINRLHSMKKISNRHNYNQYKLIEHSL